MEEKKTESEQNEDESQQNKKRIECLGFENLEVEERRTHEEWTKNGEEEGKSSRNCSRKRFRSITKASRLGFSSRKHVFSPKTAEMHSIGVRDPLEQPPLDYL